MLQRNRLCAQIEQSDTEQEYSESGDTNIILSEISREAAASSKTAQVQQNSRTRAENIITQLPYVAQKVNAATFAGICFWPMIRQRQF